MSERAYHIGDPGYNTGQVREPDYKRVAEALTDEDLDDEIASDRGEQGYRFALRDERARRIASRIRAR